MSFSLISWNAMPSPLSTERLNGIKEVLMKHGVSDTGAEQFIRSGVILNASDRQKLLELVNLVVTQVPSGPSGSGAKSMAHRGGKG